MNFEVSHKTIYSYAAPVAQSHHLIHLSPRPHERQRIGRHSLMIEPAPASRSDFTDAFGNPASILVIEQDHSELLIHSRSLIDVTAAPRPNVSATMPWPRLAEAFAAAAGPHDLEVVQYLCQSRYIKASKEFLDYARPSFPAGRPALEGVLELTARINTDFTYDNAATDVATELGHVLRIRRGVCQDFAHLEIACLRTLGLPARYVSGYMLTRPPAGRERLIGADASHAWISAWTPEMGWVDFDPTNNLIPSSEHITIAYGRDYHDVSPISGVLLGGGEHQVEVAVDITPAHSVAAAPAIHKFSLDAGS